jgi:hypothetical protein
LAVDQLLSRTTIEDLARNEEQMNRFVDDLVVLNAAPGSAPLQ